MAETKSVINTHSTSVYDGDDAGRFAEWVAKRWAGIPEHSKPTARLVLHEISGGAMLGVSWTVDEVVSQ